MVGNVGFQLENLDLIKFRLNNPIVVDCGRKVQFWLGLVEGLVSFNFGVDNRFLLEKSGLGDFFCSKFLGLVIVGRKFWGLVRRSSSDRFWQETLVIIDFGPKIWCF